MKKIKFCLKFIDYTYYSKFDKIAIEQKKKKFYQKETIKHEKPKLYQNSEINIQRPAKANN